MKKTLHICLLLFMPLSLVGQDLIATIMERNPFDPQRGQKEKEEVENLVELVPDDLPMCDGTFILGQQRYAMFTFIIEGQPVPKTLEVNQSSNGYKVTSIDYNTVIVERGNESHTIKLFFQESKMEKRGGSRKTAVKQRSPTKRGKSHKKSKVSPMKSSKSSSKPKQIIKKKTGSGRPTIVKKPKSGGSKKTRSNKKDF